MKSAVLVTAIFLGLVALAHVARLVLQLEVVVGSTLVPQWLSLFGVLVPGGLATWLWREQRARD